MFNDHHLWKLLLAFVPALIYSYIIYFNDRNNITFRTTISYLIGGYISVGLLRMIQQIFPHLQDPHFMLNNGVLDLTNFTIGQDPTLLTWALFAFVQVALFEEATKAMAFRSLSIFRKGEYKQNDSLFSTMFYSCMISVGFAGIENLDYFINMPGNDTVITRTFTAVITHMVCGLLMGYFIAISRLKKDVIQRVSYKLVGLLSAVLFHGMYDFLVFGMSHVKWDIHIGHHLFRAEPFHLLLAFGLVIVTIFGRTLLNRSIRYGLIQKRHNPSLRED